mmetsp:Transcript_17558/g.35695  ORF Transcript_17558/g.35695 Transcript_17558/m.35695 type:complete len:241 (+) Transcript_17558:254-976(+)
MPHACRTCFRQVKIMANESQWSGKRLEDGRGGGAAHAAGRVERVNAEQLVDEAAGDAQHGRTAVLALGVQLEGLDLGVVVPHPRVEGDVAGLGVVGLRLGRKAGAGLLHAGEHHDLQPARGGDGLERGEAARRDVVELQVLRGRQVARDADAGVEGDHVQEAEHGRAAVLDLHDLVAAHVAGLDQAEGVEDTQGREDTEVALREHGGRGARHGAHGGGRGLEGRGRLEQGKGNDGGRLHD